VKVTPAHDPVDFQLGRTHGLESINVMTDDAHMTNVPTAYEGLDRYDARSKLIVDLEQGGFLGSIDEHTHNVGHCYRCGTVVEPRLSPQWFVKMPPLAKPAIKAVKDGTITFHPERWTKVYLNWMENIQDWCISRQIWWGHRIPVWYCDNCTMRTAVRTGMARGNKPDPEQAGIIVSRTAPAFCPSCRSTTLRQDEDVLDTWFSSWLWPFSTLGWPQKSKDLAHFYPTTTLVTAQEIIFFWVARMIMAGYFCLKKPPFTDVYIHGTVRDITGKKMSKSLGNIIDPLDIVKQYGTDALRYTLVTATAIGQDVFLSEDRFAAGRNFANKLWNATRFVLSTVSGSELRVASSNPQPVTRNPQLSVADRWILSRLQRTITKVTVALETFLFNEAATSLYDFLWHDYCDWYLEVAKVHLSGAGGAGQRVRETTQQMLVSVLETALRLLHPIMPFVTEELWQKLMEVPVYELRVSSSRPTRNPKPVTRNSIMVAPWPKAEKKFLDLEAERLFERLQAIVAAIRNTRAELNIPLDSRPAIQLTAGQAEVRGFFDAHRPLLQSLAAVGSVEISASRQQAKDAAAIVADGVEVLMPLAGLIDAGKECSRLQQRVEELTKQLAGIEARLANTEFTSKAPKVVIDQSKERRTEVQETIKKFSDHLALLQSM
jgi:valyl-tRNA synthetase